MHHRGKGGGREREKGERGKGGTMREKGSLSGLQGMSSGNVEVRGSKSPGNSYYCDYNG